MALCSGKIRFNTNILEQHLAEVFFIYFLKDVKIS